MTYDPGYDEVREGQQVFRRLLDATAWPGKVERLPPTKVSPPAPWAPSIAQIARTLLDSQVTFAVQSADGGSLLDYLVSNTGARPVALAGAGYVIAGPPLAALDVSSIHPGTLIEPDRGATLLLACEFVLDDQEQRDHASKRNGSSQPLARSDRETVVLALGGRGIADRRTVRVDRATASAMARLAERGDEYPLGVDVILADRAGRIVSLPRTTRWSKEASPWDT